ncbi:MAG: hypothetical protein KY439_06810 [Actinobacteria bacterium]|nr:hypothetical protein [Actinomycetota bacterium]
MTTIPDQYGSRLADVAALLVLALLLAALVAHFAYEARSAARHAQAKADGRAG